MANPMTPRIETSMAKEIEVPGTPKSPKKRNRDRIIPGNLRSKIFRGWPSPKDKSPRNLLSVPPTPRSPSSPLDTSNAALSSLPSSAISTMRSVSPTRFTKYETAFANAKVLKDTTKSSIAEQPLRRPVETSSTFATPVEKPLRRPRENPELQNFQDAAIAIAMDISGSTRNQVLDQEFSAARKIYSVLSDQPKRGDIIIPWDHRLHASVTPKSLPEIKDTAGGGTKPSVLMSEPSVSILRKCSCWILFTDGEIEATEIRQFSDGIRNNELHGIACIIVIFGFKTRRPTGCNVSVGLSMFSSPPHCLFLFQDIDTEIVYILQSKGVFNDLLPKGQKQATFDKSTSWGDLPKMKYEDLLQVQLPAPRILRADDILLQNNLTVSLQDIYDSKVDAETATEILGNDDNLKSLLLTSQLRGQNDSVGNWIQNQRLKSQDILFIPRPDIDSKASYYVKLLLQRFHLESSERKNESEIKDWQRNLRISHEVNRTSLMYDTGIKRKQAHRRSQVVTDAISRIRMNEFEVDSPSSPCTPVVLATVSPSHEDAGPSAPSPRVRRVAEHRRDQYSSNYGSEYGYPDLALDASDSEDSLDIQNSIEMDVLFIPGYRYDRGSASAVGLEGTCPLCDSESSILAMLLKKRPSDIETVGFPAPRSRTGLLFPLAMGTFPETDILSPFVCCDACAYHLVQLQKSPYDETIIAAIPLIPEAICGSFRNTTFDAVDNALEKRFERPPIEQVFLSIIHNTLESSEGEYELTEKEALRWASSMITLHTSIPTTLSSSFSGHLSPRGCIPIPMALSQSLASLPKPSPPLLQYPLTGFVVMLQAMVDMSLEPKPNARQSAVFQRIIFHLIEKYYEMYMSDTHYTTEVLHSLLWRPQATHEEQAQVRPSTPRSPKTTAQVQHRQDPAIPIVTVPILLLRGTGLMSEYDWDIFQRLGGLFDHVKDECSCAIAYFLHELEKQMPTSLTPVEIFDKMRTMSILTKVFNEPERITEQNIANTYGLSQKRNVGKQQE